MRRDGWDREGRKKNYYVSTFRTDIWGMILDKATTDGNVWAVFIGKFLVYDES